MSPGVATPWPAAPPIPTAKVCCMAPPQAETSAAETSEPSNLPAARDRLYLPGLIRAVKTALDRAGRTQIRFSCLCEKLLPNSQSYFLKRSRVYNSCLCKTTELILG